MNNSLWIEIIFWTALFIVFYTYLGYGIVLCLLVKLKELFVKPVRRVLPAADRDLPEVTLFITAFNEEDIVDEKMANSLELDYPEEKLHIVWVTDGSDDGTNERLRTRWEGKATVFFQPERQGKTAAMNRGMKLVDTPIVVFTDANTMVNRQAVREIVLAFEDPRVGCVAGEKRIAVQAKDNAASGGEGIYWRYESTLKALDARLYSAVGAAGELFAVRRELFAEMERDTLLDDFVLSLRIAMQGYIIAYCTEAYAIESGSADMREEEKRKVRIAAGGLQSHLAAAPPAEPVPLRDTELPVRIPSGAEMVRHPLPAVPAAAAQCAAPADEGACRRFLYLVRCPVGTSNPVLRPRPVGLLSVYQTDKEQAPVHPLLLPLHERQRTERNRLPEEKTRNRRVGKSQKKFRIMIHKS